MPRTVTGTYTLRPTSYYSYLSSGTFANYFSTSTSAPSSWTTKMDITTQIGDNSDSTYYAHNNIGTSAASGRNVLMNLTLTAGSIPEFDYTITSVSLNYRSVGAYASNASRKLNLWFSIWDATNGGASPSAADTAGKFLMKTTYASSGSLSTTTASIATKTYNITSFAHSSLLGGEFPDRLAICEQAYRTSAFTAFSYWRLHDVWFTISYSYVENEKTVHYNDDSGVDVTTNGVKLDSGSVYQDYKYTQYPLVAEVLPGYIFDGWYLNGLKVSSDLSYTYTFNGNSDWLYCITKKRKIFVGDYQVDEVYIGTTPVREIYEGDECIWGDSELYGDATAVG